MKIYKLKNYYLPLRQAGLFFGILLLLISCDDIIFEEDISNSYVKTLAPTSGTNVKAGTISFNWEWVNDATEYQIQIASPSFNDAAQIVLDSMTTNTVYTVDLTANSYEWRIRAKNSAFETSYFTNAFTVIEE
ncbi:MAG: hypothetical protein L3J08_08020 [Flavobacteriaceae bacterium]|nr:hypothetical protein [Flavobacteriaceae bacterium]